VDSRTGIKDNPFVPPQARRRPLAITGPLTGQRGWFAELLHVRWLIDFGASKPVLEAQQRGIPDIYQLAAHPAANILFDRLRRDSADVGQAMAAAQGLGGAS
jgi:hypothetical protein